MRVARVIASVVVMSLALALAACGGEAEPTVAPTETPETKPFPTATSLPATATATPQESAAIDTTDSAPIVSPMGGMLAALNIVDTAGFHGMTTDLEKAASIHTYGPAIGTYVGLDAIGGLGLHGLSTDLAAMTDASQISARTAGQVKNVLAVMGATAWPEEVSEELAAFREDLEELRDALVAADLAGAQMASHEAHETTHDLSSAAYDWLAQQAAEPGSGIVAVLGTYVGLDAIGGLGLHGLSTDLAAMTDASQISARTAGQVKNALAVMGATAWPEEVSEELAAFREDLEELLDALVAADLAGAQMASHEAHETNHDLSTAAYDWLAQQTAESGSGIVAALGTYVGLDAIGGLGLHGLSNSLNEMTDASQISGRTAGQVKNVLAVMGATAWSEEVSEELAAFREDLEELLDALVAADLAGAQMASHEAHETTHDLSSAAYDWLAQQDGLELMSSLFSSRYLGTVRNVIAATRAASWEGEMPALVQALGDQLSALETALAANDAVAAAHAAGEVHYVQHDFSAGMYEWMAAQGSMHMSMHGADVGSVVAAVNMVDSAGFHDLSEAIESAAVPTDISSRDARKVHNIRLIVEAVDWPDEISAEATGLNETLKALDEALASANLAAAKGAAESLHEKQHDFSLATYDWLATQKEVDSSVGALIAVVDLVGSAGFHGMATAHAAAVRHADISSRDLRTMRHVLAAAEAVAWPTDVAAAAHEFTHDLEEHIAAMESGNLAACQAAAEAVHHSQHDFSTAVYAQLGT